MKNTYSLYSIPLTVIKAKVKTQLQSLTHGPLLISEIDLIIKNLLVIAKFMLVDRFTPSQKKEKGPVDNRHPDLKKFLGIIPMEKTIVKKEELNLLDIIKFFKMLENFMLKRAWLYSLENFSLGHLRPNCQAIVDSLPTLLLSVDELEDFMKDSILNFLFSAIVVYRLFKVKAIPDITTISADYTGDSLDLIISKFFNSENITKWLETFLSNFNRKNPVRLVMYSGNASSPNSGASTNSLYNDVAAVAKDEKLWSNILKMASFFKNGDDFTKLITLISENISINSKVIHSRLFSFTASGGKARIIANVDWVTQTALSGIHYTLFAILKSATADFTFDHKAGTPHVLSTERKEGYNFYSIDLSAATDRLPRILQGKLIAALFTLLGFDGDQVEKAWLGIVDRTFSTEGSVLNNQQPIKYTVGQGMGIFTSFPVLGLMHHFIVNWIVGISADRYCIVGDDLLFYGTPEEYQQYLDFMKSIGVTVNPGKTIESQDPEKPTIEFARNFIIQGIKINPIPFGMLFAYKDEKITLETVAWAFLKTMPIRDFIEILKGLEIKLTAIEAYSLGYYVFKNSEVDFKELYRILNQFVRLPKWFSIENLRKIIKIVSEGNQNLRSVAYTNSEFLATYSSACIVRHREEIERNHLIADSIEMLAIVDKSVFELSEKISERLRSTDLIAYDIELKGGPLLTKREVNLLELIDQTNNNQQ